MLLKQYFSRIIPASLLAAVVMSVSSCDTMDSKEVPYLSVSAMAFELNYYGYWYNDEAAENQGDPSLLESNFEVAANLPWTITTDADWLTLSETSGERGRYRIFVKADENTTRADRSATITVTAGQESAKIDITQTGKEVMFTVKPGTVTVDKDGLAENGDKATIRVSANGQWTAAPGVSWITLDKTAGGSTSETTTVDDIITLTVSALSSGERDGTIVFEHENGSKKTVKVEQVSVFVDDGKAVGYEYYYEPFDWCIPFGTDDQVSNMNTYSNIAIYSNAAAMQAFLDAGLEDYSPSSSCVYIMAHYLKFNKGNNQSGLILPAFTEIGSDYATNITLTFDVAPNVTATAQDPVEWTVEVLEGPGTVDGLTSKTSESMSHEITTDGVWETKQVTLYNITGDSRIVIRSTQQGQSGQYRFFLDEIRCVKHSVVQ